MKALFKYFDIHESVVLVLGITLTLLLGVIDYLTGYEISFSIFYLLPILLVSWFCKRNQAIFISVLCAITWLLADLMSGHIYPNVVIPIWNSIMRLGFFFMATAISKLLKREQLLARSDFLTGVVNGMAFNEIAKVEIDRFVRFGRPFSVAYIDIDNFKQVNDTLGHSQGDYFLQLIAKRLKENTRSIDTVSRLGGDEFAILFPETDEENVKSATGKLQDKLLNVVAENNNWHITVSMGVITCYKTCKVDELIKEADSLMYVVKNSGKNGIGYKIYGNRDSV